MHHYKLRGTLWILVLTLCFFPNFLDPSRSPVPNVTVSWSRDSKAPAGCPFDCIFLGFRAFRVQGEGFRALGLSILPGLLA